MADGSNQSNDPKLKAMTKAVEEALANGAAHELFDAIRGNKPDNNQPVNQRSTQKIDITKNTL